MASDVSRVLDVDRLGLATYFLAVIYMSLAISASFKLKRINKFINQWNSQKAFHHSVVIHLYVRAFSFGLLSLFSVLETHVWYTLEVILFTLPEFFIISTYILLFFHWLEIYIFSHEQFLINSRDTFSRRWKLAFAIFTCLFYVLLTTLYVVLAVRADVLQDQIFTLIEYSSAVANFVLPSISCLLLLYFGCALSGFPFASAMAKERVSKINTVFALWTFGRIARGVMLVISIEASWQQSLNSTYFAMFVMAILTLAEFFPLLTVLDWSVIGFLLLGEESEVLARGGESYGGLVGSDSFSANHDKQGWMIDMSELRFSPDALAQRATDSTFRGSWNGRPIAARAFRLNGLSASTTDELVDELVEASAVSHPNVVQFYGVSKANSTIYQIHEFMPRGSLAELIAHVRQPFSTFHVLRLSRDLCCGMLHLHSIGQTHGHLSSSNCLLDGSMTLKVGDVGVRKLKAYAEVVMLTERSVSAYSAPEVLRGLGSRSPLLSIPCFPSPALHNSKCSFLCLVLLLCL